MTVSSTMPPVPSSSRQESVEELGLSLSRDEGVTFISSSMAPGPLRWCCTLPRVRFRVSSKINIAGMGNTYIWLTSNTLAFSLVQWWLST